MQFSKSLFAFLALTAFTSAIPVQDNERRQVVDSISDSSIILNTRGAADGVAIPNAPRARDEDPSMTGDINAYEKYQKRNAEEPGGSSLQRRDAAPEPAPRAGKLTRYLGWKTLRRRKPKPKPQGQGNGQEKKDTPTPVDSKPKGGTKVYYVVPANPTNMPKLGKLEKRLRIFEVQNEAAKTKAKAKPWAKHELKTTRDPQGGVKWYQVTITEKQKQELVNSKKKVRSAFLVCLYTLRR